MPWMVTFDPATRIVETRYEGQLLPDELQAAVQRTIQCGLEHRVRRFLGDCSRLEGGHSPFDLYEIANQVSGLGIGAFREAVLLPAAMAPRIDVRFYETTSLNHGLKVRVFVERGEAIGWLLEQADE